MLIRTATSSDISAIHKLAHEIWPSAYQNIIPAEQIEFMLNNMYSHESLNAQFNEHITFLIAEEDNSHAVGFASFSLSDQQLSIFKINKLYILSQQQGKGIGKLFIDYIKEDARAKGGKFLELNVNRNNPAYNFYKKYGFEIFAEADIPYYQYTLNDYIMRMPL